MAEAAGMHGFQHMHPHKATESSLLLKDRLERPRSIFAPGMRIKMNIVPMFLNVFAPWGVFILSCGVTSFMVYSKPVLARFYLGLAFVFWLICVGLAVWARRSEPEPTWFSYFAIMIGIALFGGMFMGRHNYETRLKPYYEIRDLKVVENIDAGKERGPNVMDAGIFSFAEGNRLDTSKGWHFKHGSLYCVAPIIGNMPTPETATYDFWAVGKDCCSVSSSDFRCGAFDDPSSRGGIRVLDMEARPFYRLAVQQAESLYGITAQHPIFIEWSQDPVALARSWNTAGFTSYVGAVATFFVMCVFFVVIAVFKFSWIGRLKSVYDPRGFFNEEARLRENLHHHSGAAHHPPWHMAAQGGGISHYMSP